MSTTKEIEFIKDIQAFEAGLGLPYILKSGAKITGKTICVV